jgi:type II restriction/modification system DNA methylase subunit YeeA
MELKAIKPRKALNKAFLKLKPNRSDIESFKTNLIELIDCSNLYESEEFHKNLITDFLRKTYYRQSENFINTKGRNDLVIYNGKNSKTTVGAIIEAKKTSNKYEMLSLENINVKAFHELILYYLRERISEKNLDVKHLIATNINEWFIFEANVFEKLFASNKTLVKQFTDFEEGRLSGKDTEFFYLEIAKPFVESIKSEIIFTHFDLRNYEKHLRNDDKKDDTKLVALYKLFSPEHMLKLPFANDSNSLDKRFYAELLHIIGLTETKQGNKKLIERKGLNERNSGSIIENVIIQLDSLDKINRLENPRQYGATMQERLFSVGLELAITWINRILFLKLLEAQLIKYHKGNTAYAFLNLDRIHNYDDLNTLFFQVLAKKHEDRNLKVKDAYSKIPFLNSSLFEPNDLEHKTLLISNLSDDDKIPILSSTVLKDNTGKKRTGELTTLEYLFEFLDSYDFSSEGAEDIQEDNKTLINASVLGLIFEKINGYKDGSFFTPGFITMYMCRETIRRAVLQKFNETKGWNCENLNDIFNKDIELTEANQIVNSIKICDPAVGSGHFLVSALNEIISVKNDLKILTDREGKRLKHYNIEVVNDELIVTDEDGELFEYNPSSKESQRLQQTLFHEKQTIIENCLFGVDINPNSVKICRLRLWIELLKNAYYKNETELETLPNIDINIKCGNSLVSRFSLDSDLKQALKKSKWSIDSYRVAVQTYRNAKNKEQKHEMEKLIKTIKNDFRTEIAANSKELKDLNKWKGELENLITQTTLFEKTAKEKKEFDKTVKILAEKIKKQEVLIEEIKNNKIYENAFEWRFEFPEVLNDDGEFVGFDVVIGNPPYFSLAGAKIINDIYKSDYTTFASGIDIYCLFVEKSEKIIAKNYFVSFIVSNKWKTASYGAKTREYLSNSVSQLEIIDFKRYQIFDEANVDSCIISFTKSVDNSNELKYKIHNGNSDIIIFLNDTKYSKIENLKNYSIWNLSGFNNYAIKNKIEKSGKPLKNWEIKFYRGITTGLNEAFIIDEKTKNELCKNDDNNKQFIKPLLRGRDIERYICKNSNLWLIYIPKGFTIKNNINTFHNDKLGEPPPRYGNMEYEEANKWFQSNYSFLYNYLLVYKNKLENRFDKGDFWWELRACAYLEDFEIEKIVFTKASKVQAFTIDNKGHYLLNTSYFIVGERLKYLLGLLNSKLIKFCFINFYQSGGIEGEITLQALEKIPISIPKKNIEEKISKITEDIFNMKKQNPAADSTSLESEIDHLVYELYGLSEEEIAVVEDSVK